MCNSRQRPVGNPRETKTLTRSALPNVPLENRRASGHEIHAACSLRPCTQAPKKLPSSLVFLPHRQAGEPAAPRKPNEGLSQVARPAAANNDLPSVKDTESMSEPAGGQSVTCAWLTPGATCQHCPNDRLITNCGDALKGLALDYCSHERSRSAGDPPDKSGWNLILRHLAVCPRCSAFCRGTYLLESWRARIPRPADSLEDIAQDTVRRLLEGPWDPNRGPLSKCILFKAWAACEHYERHRAKQEGSRRQRRDEDGQDPLDRATANPKDFDPARGAARRADAAEMGKALERLPVEVREIIEAYYWHGKTWERIAEDRDVPIATVYRRAQKGIHELRKCLH